MGAETTIDTPASVQAAVPSLKIALEPRRVDAQQAPALQPLDLRQLSITEPLLIGSKAVASMIGLGESTFFRLLAKGEFGPRPIKLGGRRLYSVQEVREWISSRLPNGCLPSRVQWEQIRIAKKK